PECSNTTPPVYEGDYVDDLDSIDDEGTVPVPDGPGLGVEYDWDYIEENRTGGRTYE
ncbi:MAG: mandelate racemase, partial [Haladaptatus sp.]